MIAVIINKHSENKGDETHEPLKELKGAICMEDYNLRLPRGSFNLYILVSYAGFTCLFSLLFSDKICTYNGN